MDRGALAARLVGMPTTSNTLALMVGPEYFRLELATAVELHGLEGDLDRAKRDLDEIDQDGRRAERRLKLELDAEAQEVRMYDTSLVQHTRTAQV